MVTVEETTFDDSINVISIALGRKILAPCTDMLWLLATYTLGHPLNFVHTPLPTRGGHAEVRNIHVRTHLPARPLARSPTHPPTNLSALAKKDGQAGK